MKIRLLTFHNAHNYGALLQCFSMASKLSEYGACKILNYASVKRDYRLVGRYRGLKNKLRAILRYVPLKKRYESMTAFIEEFDVTEAFDGQSLYTHSFEDCTCVVGSDQIWSCKPSIYDKAYFLEGVTAGRKVAYAASMGRSEIPEHLQDTIGKAVKDFAAVSVREKSLGKLLHDTYGMDVPVVLDPVFLQTKDFWSKQARPIKTPEKYILVYFLEVPVNGREVLETLKKQCGMPVLAITTINSGRKYGADKDYIAVGPREFLWLFEHAQFVVTSSFHGTAFSLVFEKQFYTLPKRDTAERMTDLLGALGLENRILHQGDAVCMEEIAYHEVTKKIEVLKAASEQFLKEALLGEALERKSDVSGNL